MESTSLVVCSANGYFHCGSKFPVNQMYKHKGGYFCKECIDKIIDGAMSFTEAMHLADVEKAESDAYLDAKSMEEWINAQNTTKKI